MRYLMALGFFINLFSAKSQYIDFNAYPVYHGNDLGLTYSPLQSSFRIWSPPAHAAVLLLYHEGIGGKAYKEIKMKKSEGGTWIAKVNGDLRGKFYAFRVRIGNAWLNEVPDPYIKAAGVNGKRGAVVELKETDPQGWEQDVSPPFLNKTDAIIYELHVRDASISKNSGISNKGKFPGLTETGTKTADGLPTGVDHIKQLGVTHVHLLPVYDYSSVDETKSHLPHYNWGYDPLNYNVPEGSYSTDPSDPLSRIKEFKQLIKTFHENGLRVVMDVVYNHTGPTEGSSFNQLVPGYYYRQAPGGGFSNASACGNETASERTMMRKFMLESMLYWVKEYHVDGFRVDLMGIHDIETMNLVSAELHKIRPDILIYGEGWTAGSSPLPDTLKALKKFAYRLDRIAVFSDDVRDGIKGHVFTPAEKGFVSGKTGTAESVKFGVVAALPHPQIDYSKVNYSNQPYAAQPHHTITYVDCHDNHVLWDRLAISAANYSEQQRTEMHKLALSIVLTSQGISFLHAGTEFKRSKKGVENSFESADSINAIDWDLKRSNIGVHDYVRGLVELRKNHPAFRLKTAQEVADLINFLVLEESNLVAFTINGSKAGDPWKNILVVYNGSSDGRALNLPPGKWKSSIIGNKFQETEVTEPYAQVPAFSCSIYYQE